MKLLSSFILSATCFTVLTVADGLEETIYGAFIYTFYGDRTPLVESNPTLTPLGAQQLYTAGSAFRDRYISSSTSGTGTTIAGISEYEIDNEQVSVLAYFAQYSVASAQAFMQGLYPPTDSSVNYTSVNSLATLANGSSVDSPLNGYQYPEIYTVADSDPNSIWVAGNVDCPSYESAMSDYFSSTQYNELEQSSLDFYQSLAPIMDGIMSNASLGYFDAYYIYDYLNYGMTHNSTVASSLSTATFDQLRTLADQWTFAMNANTTSSNGNDASIRAVSGRTFASQLASDIYTNVNTDGVENKITLTFGSYEPIMAFASLVGLAKESSSQFYGQPQYGSSMVIELYALEANSSTSYPSQDDLLIRFLFQNGTGSDAQLTEFPLFGDSPSNIAIHFDDFLTGLEDIMTGTPEEWCNSCSSASVFCAGYDSTSGSSTGGSSSSGGSSYSSSGSKSSNVRPVVAGVIGAMVTLVVMASVIALVMLLGGVRLYRRGSRRRSELGGFKGEKLASDQDLTIPKTGAGATVAETGIDGTPRGHERVGSWEMGQSAKLKTTPLNAAPSTRRPSFEDDDLHVTPYAEPVKAADKV